MKPGNRRRCRLVPIPAAHAPKDEAGYKNSFLLLAFGASFFVGILLEEAQHETLLYFRIRDRGPSR